MFSIFNVNKKFWEDLIGYFLPVLQRPHRKRLVQQFLYSFMCILCHGNVFTEALPSDVKRYTYRHRRMGDVYYVRRSGGSSTMIRVYIPGFLNIGSGIQKLG
jgi:hypothetical protein